jgi:hypothetical protein
MNWFKFHKQEQRVKKASDIIKRTLVQIERRLRQAQAFTEESNDE